MSELANWRALVRHAMAPVSADLCPTVAELFGQASSDALAAATTTAIDDGTDIALLAEIASYWLADRPEPEDMAERSVRALVDACLRQNGVDRRLQITDDRAHYVPLAKRVTTSAPATIR